MEENAEEYTNSELLIADIPFMTANSTEIGWLTPDGELKTIPHAQARILIHDTPVILCHAPYICKKLEIKSINSFDILELYAFIYPCNFITPTPSGLAKYLKVAEPENIEEEASIIYEATISLFHDLAKMGKSEKTRNQLLLMSEAMGLNGKGWKWTPYIFNALGEKYNPKANIIGGHSLNIWNELPEYTEEAPPPPPSHYPVSSKESEQRLKQLLSTKKMEARQSQIEYAKAITHAFTPTNSPEEKHIVLAEAGTGVGKTLGYIAPASVWAEKNEGSVWISTYTKNLQKQISMELDLLYPNKEIKEKEVTIRKGRENYLCLLNLEEIANSLPLTNNPNHAIAAGLMARWASETKDGDLTGYSFHGWLPGLLGHTYTTGLSDRRGECIYAGCDHFHKCFVEKSIRKSKRAKLVIANHALVMINSILSDPDHDLPQRYIFDEAHHLMDAADSAYASHLTMKETNDLRKWILGTETGRKTRSKGLKRRTEEIISGDKELEEALKHILIAANELPSENWQQRIREQSPKGSIEKLLHIVHQQILTRTKDKNSPYSIETETRPIIEGLLEAANNAKKSLEKIKKPINILAAKLRKKLAEDDGELNNEIRKRIETTALSLERRSNTILSGWINILDTLNQDKTPEEFVDWMEIERIDGKSYDVGIYRHWKDPMIPFAQSIKEHAAGIAITSATLTDSTGIDKIDINTAMERTGARHITDSSTIFRTPSPYNYAENSKIFIINDIDKNNLDQLASAYKSLFMASKGGALGLFTAINRLKYVHSKIVHAMEHEGYPLLAQHVDEINISTLIDIFKDNKKSCLLGTDAIRDGVDVPGDSLKLLIFDRVPWPRPTYLHKARRNIFGKRQYDEMLTRLKIKQAYGRLIRNFNDRGIFIMMDNMFPSRLHSAFPKDVEIEKISISEAIIKTRNFFNKQGNTLI